jgi:hypothetical protein
MRTQLFRTDKRLCLRKREAGGGTGGRERRKRREGPATSADQLRLHGRLSASART